MNRRASASVLSVDGPYPAGRGAGAAPGVRGAHGPRDPSPRAVALYAKPWLTFQLVPRGRCYRARGTAYAVARTGGRMRQQAADAAQPLSCPAAGSAGVTR